MDASITRIEKRNRPPVSCEPCRTRKLKCNRSLPCDTCVKRNKTSLCHFAANANRGKPGGNPKQRDLKDRLNALEDLVSSFVAGNAIVQPVSGHIVATKEKEEQGAAADRLEKRDETSSATAAKLPAQLLRTPDSTIASVDGSWTETDRGGSAPASLHLQETRDGQHNYIDPSHWQSVLEDIKEVRDHLNADFDSGHPAAPSAFSQDQADIVEPDASFLFGTAPKNKLADVISSLPPQPACDVLLSWFFNYRHLVPGCHGIIHPLKFQQEYESFWKDPLKASPLWIALLFSLLSFTSTLRQVVQSSASDSNLPSVRELQQAAVQCLVLGRYATANEHALEAFLLHLLSCTIAQTSAPVDLWFEMGTLIRLAFRMGYHRDPSRLRGGAISPFAGEMRRRLWVNIYQMEAIMSFQMGLPSMIPEDVCDAGVPQNLENSDLHPDMVTLPPPRPTTEYTPVLYSIAKAGIMKVFKKIVVHVANPTAPPAYERTIALGLEMDQAYGDVPEVLRRRDVNRSFVDPAGIILQRCTLEMLYLKGLVVLHRRYTAFDARSSPAYESSRRACIGAALDILARQADVHEACEPGNRLHDDRRMFLALPAHDYLLAAMVVCLDLSVRMRRGLIAPGEADDAARLVGREYRALRVSHRIWTAKSGSALAEAQLAALALDVMVKRLADHDARLPHHGVDDGFDTLPAFGLELPYADTMSHMIEGSETIDWDLLDQYFQNMDGLDMDFTV